MKRPTLHLGVVVQPYRTTTRKARALTTGEVAEFLEEKYGVMAAFYRVHGDDVVRALENSMSGALESLVMGQYTDPYGTGMQQIENAFREFIVSREAERVGIPGTPTHAALMGVNHRMKHPYAKRASRPSFLDTSLYMSSFKAWMDDE